MSLAAKSSLNPSDIDKALKKFIGKPSNFTLSKIDEIKPDNLISSIYCYISNWLKF